MCCDSDYEEAGVVLFGAPFDSTTSYRPVRALAVPLFAGNPMDWKVSARIRNGIYWTAVFR